MSSFIKEDVEDFETEPVYVFSLEQDKEDVNIVCNGEVCGHIGPDGVFCVGTHEELPTDEEGNWQVEY